MFTVEKCPEPVLLPGPEMRNVKPSDGDEDDDDYNYDWEDTFNIIELQPKLKLQPRTSRGAMFQVWEHYIAIEELTWDYTPHLSSTDKSGRRRRHIQAGRLSSL